MRVMEDCGEYAGNAKNKQGPTRIPPAPAFGQRTLTHNQA